MTPELARYLTELSSELKRQLGVIIDRRGTVVATIVGDEKEIVIPVLVDYPLGRSALRGVRCIHTHLRGEPLSKDDLTDLSLLRLDAMAAIGLGTDGLPGDVFLAHLVPVVAEGPPKGPGEIHRERAPYELRGPMSLASLEEELGDFSEFVTSIEAEMGRASLRKTGDLRERAVLVSVSTKPKETQLEYLNELSALAETSQVVVVSSVTQRIQRLNPRYLMGSGKIRELIITALQKEATLLIFDQELTPTQIRELGELTELKVIDRTQLILDIFARRAHTRDGKVQVELAQLKYLLPRLTGKGTSMSRLMGGIGGRGPGETKLEVDRRRVQNRIARLERELKALGRGRKQRRAKRARSGIPIISIVGYTNAGKSTLLNALTKSTTPVEDKLFATLDTATRRLRFPRERDAVITDTVGFIRELPRELKRAFRSTLEEMEDADLLLQLVDISDPGFEERIETVRNILGELDLDEIPRLLVFNKTDRVDPVIAGNLARRHNAIAVSALRPETLLALEEELEKRLWPGEGVGTGATEKVAEGSI